MAFWINLHNLKESLAIMHKFWTNVQFQICLRSQIKEKAEETAIMMSLCPRRSRTLSRQKNLKPNSRSTRMKKNHRSLPSSTKMVLFSSINFSLSTRESATQVRRESRCFQFKVMKKRTVQLPLLFWDPILTSKKWWENWRATKSNCLR